MDIRFIRTMSEEADEYIHRDDGYEKYTVSIYKYISVVLAETNYEFS